MTTIAFKDGTLAADTMTTDGARLYKHGTKIGCGRDAKGYFLVGCVGDAALCSRFLAWATKAGGEVNHLDRPSMKQGEREASGFFFRMTAAFEWKVEEHEADLPPIEFPVTSSYGFAAGSGKDLALGAMYYGAKATDAVEAAMAYDVYTGGEVQYVIMPTDDLPRPCVLPTGKRSGKWRSAPRVVPTMLGPKKASTKKR